ncbi:MAG: GPR endopeptidase [Ruminococcus sp.]|nr:GPR endopeptidase [Ruminococcus sp.]
MNFRSDLAVEQVKIDSLPAGVTISNRGKVFDITEIIISDDSFRNSLGKGMGKYITLESGNLSHFSDEYENMVKELAEEFRKLIPEGEVLVVGLGNRDITPDAIGPRIAEKVLATRHLLEEITDSETSFLSDLRRVSSVAGGVMGQTGIETAELIRAICNEIKPSAVIAADALACSDVSRLGTTIQICDSGISPGSGVSNSRKELSKDFLGVPVIAVGVPTVVDMHTIIRNLTNVDVEADIPNMLVTPRDIDRLTERASQLIAFSINLALHPSLSFSDVQALF